MTHDIFHSSVINKICSAVIISFYLLIDIYSNLCEPEDIWLSGLKQHEINSITFNKCLFDYRCLVYYVVIYCIGSLYVSLLDALQCN